MDIIYNGEKDKNLYKDAIGGTIIEMANEDPKFVYLDADLMSCVGTAKWAKENPDRGINVGIAESNMVGIACGLASQGFKPTIHTFGPFASRRVYDQVFLSAGYAKNDITIIGSDPGVTAALNGGTHMPFEDVALYRAIPTATVIDITDIPMLKSVLKQYKDMPGVKYLRVGRKNPVKVYADGETFEIGKGKVLKEGKDAVIFACGIMVAESLAAAAKLAEEGINVTVVDMFTIKPLDEELVVKYAKETGAVIVAENHNKIGGLYSAVADCLAANCPTPAEYVAVEDEYGEVGPQDYLQERFGLTSAKIVEKVKKAIARK